METSAAERRSWWRTPLAAYALMIAGTIGAFFLIRLYGETLTATQLYLVDSGTKAPTTSRVLFHVLLALAAVIAVGRLLAALFRLLGQPSVIGEVMAGIVLGPSVLGAIWPEAASVLLPKDVAPELGLVAQLGVILYMFCVGLELDPDLLQKRGPATIAVSHASIAVPFLLGALVALGMYPRYAAQNVSFTVYALFIGAAMSVTAFPVLARILADCGMMRTPLGVMALTCAAADDATAWCLLALVVGVAQAEVASALYVIVSAMIYVLVMFWMVRPALRRWSNRFHAESLPATAVATLLLLLMLSSLATELIGIHAIFGAFLLGAIMPHDSRVAHELNVRIESLVTMLLLPAFFALTGMRTELALLQGSVNWLWCGIIVVAAIAGKVGGTVAAARLTGLTWREASSLGVLMNTRGLMGLIVLNIGLDLEIISPAVFAMMVVMALVTTLATTPVLRLLARPQAGGGIEENFSGGI